MKEPASLALDARHLVLRQAMAHYQQMYPASSRGDIVSELLDESVSVVLQKLTSESESPDLGDPADEPAYLSNLSAYLFGVFKNKLRNFQRKKAEEVPAHYPDEISDHGSFVGKIEKQILIAEIVRHFSREERFIFDCILLGYTFDEIAAKFAEEFKTPVTAVALRVRFHRAVSRLARSS